MVPERNRIIFVDHTAELGGGEIALLNLVSHLDRSRFHPIVAVFSDGPLVTRLIAAGIDVSILPLSPKVTRHRKDRLGALTLLRLPDVWRTAQHARQLKRLIVDTGADLVHTNSLKADVIGGLAGRLAGVPVVWHVRDRIADDYLPSYAARAFRWLARYVPRHVVANSLSTLDTLDLGGGTVVYSGVVLPEPVGPRNVTRPTNPTVGLIGRIAPWKGQEVFVRAAAVVHERFPACRFKIVGSALFGSQSYERRVRELVRTLGLQHVVEFTGFVDDVREVIAGLDVVVHASTTAEPFGQVIVEGMAAGKPVVATAGGGVTEIVVDGVTGLLVPMGDADAMATAVNRLLGDPALAATLAEAGRQRARDQFTIQHTVDRIQAVYDNLLGTKSLPR